MAINIQGFNKEILDSYGVKINIHPYVDSEKDDTIIYHELEDESKEESREMVVKYYFNEKLARIALSKCQNSQVFYNFFKKNGEYWIWIQRYMIDSDHTYPLLFVNLDKKLTYENLIPAQYSRIEWVNINQSENTLFLDLGIPGYRQDSVIFADFTNPENGCEILGGISISNIWGYGSEDDLLEDRQTHKWNGDIFEYNLSLLHHSEYGYIRDWKNGNITKILADPELKHKLTYKKTIEAKLVRKNDEMVFKEKSCSETGEKIFDFIFEYSEKRKN